MSNSYRGAFLRKSKLLKDINYFCQKTSFIIGFWQGPKYPSEGVFFKTRKDTP